MKNNETACLELFYENKFTLVKNDSTYNYYPLGWSAIYEGKVSYYTNPYLIDKYVNSYLAYRHELYRFLEERVNHSSNVKGGNIYGLKIQQSLTKIIQSLLTEKTSIKDNLGFRLLYLKPGSYSFYYFHGDIESEINYGAFDCSDASCLIGPSYSVFTKDMKFDLKEKTLIGKTIFERIPSDKRKRINNMLRFPNIIEDVVINQENAEKAGVPDFFEYMSLVAEFADVGK
jgi:hypothetical protein